MTKNDVVAMVAHWLSTPKNAYFGQNYGQSLKRELLKNTSAFNADNLLVSMKKDIPLLANLSQNELSVLAEHEGFDKINVFVKVFDVLIAVTDDNLS